MKKICLLLLAALHLTLFTNAQQVDQVQRTLISNKTATWCEYCGKWGLPLWDDVMSDNDNDKALPVALHESGSSYLFSSAASDIYNQFDVIGSTPRFYVNAFDANVTSQPNGAGGTYTTATRNQIKRMVDSLYLLAPLANVGFNFSVNGNNLTVNTKSKFFQAASGEYYVNTYLVFRNVQKNQRVQNLGYVMTTHHELLRYSATSGNNFGVSVASGTIAPGSEYLNTFTYSLDPTWTHSDITILTLMWKKNGSTYEFVNGTRKEMDPTTAIGNVTRDNAGINIFPTVSNDKVFVNLDQGVAANVVNIRVHEITGRLIYSGNKTIDAFRETIELNKVNNFGNQAGLYLLTLEVGEVRKTVRVVIN